MALSNAERQARYRATRRALLQRKQRGDELLARLVEDHRRHSEDLLKHLEMLEKGQLRSMSNNVDTTTESVARAKRDLALLDEALDRYAREVNLDLGMALSEGADDGE